MIASFRRPVLALGATVTLCSLGAATPMAARADATANCPRTSTSQPFARWGDESPYVLVPGGDFESLSWTLAGGAQQLAGSEPFAATGSLGDYSASIPTGASAESPTICVDASDQTVRFFVGGAGTVAVAVVHLGREFPVGLGRAVGKWAPSQPILIGPPVIAALTGGTAQVSFEFTALSGDPQVDDVFLDPWNRG